MSKCVSARRARTLHCSLEKMQFAKEKGAQKKIMSVCVSAQRAQALHFFLKNNLHTKNIMKSHVSALKRRERFICLL